MSTTRRSARSNFAVGQHGEVQRDRSDPRWAVASRSFASVYYNGQSGRPYVLVFNGDVNGDNRFTNDILYVPNNASEITVTNGTFDQLMTYLRGDNSTAGPPAEFRSVTRVAPRGPTRSISDMR